MTRADFDSINRNRVMRGQKPLTWVESPSRQKPPLRIETAVSLLAEKREREVKAKTQKLKAANGKGSHLEQRFLMLWTAERGPELEREFRFHPSRKWRADFAHLKSRTLIEIEGGAFNGRHTRGNGFLADAEKYLAAFLAGWQVCRLTAPQLTAENVRAVAVRICETNPPN